MVKQAGALALIGAGILAVSYSLVDGLLWLFNPWGVVVVIEAILVPGGVGIMLIRLGWTLSHHQKTARQRRIDQHSVTVEVE